MKNLLLSFSLIIATPFAHASIDQIDNAVNNKDIKGLKQLAQQTSGYQQAYADYRLAITANIVGQRQLTASSLERAARTLVSLNQQQPNADTAVLLASVYGMQMGTGQGNPMELGIKSNTLLTQAEHAEPTNPRLWKVKAISAYNTPAQYGGSMEKAKAYASKAIENFNQPCDDICWGLEEAYTWHGLAKQELGDIKGAKQDFGSAIDNNAEYAWAKFLLSRHAK
ncbi:hypothetical protein [Shewanella maritima]|uniref:hypothetical protein n=1 Tax=Shewanella maritima TaxID=2520507 RepID=UPI00373503DB